MKPVRLVLLALLLALSADADATQEPTWPELQTPAGARVESVADDMILNGRRSRIQRLSLSASVSDLLAFYRQQLHGEFVENPLRGAVVIAARQGDYFQTVQVKEVAPNLVEATIMTTLLRYEPGQSLAAMDTRKWLPSGTAVLSSLQSNDSGHGALMLVATNQLAVEANREHLITALRERGFQLVRQEPAELGSVRGVILHFSSPNEAVNATIADVGNGRALLINRTKELK
jgi:hypothetical protein